MYQKNVNFAQTNNCIKFAYWWMHCASIHLLSFCQSMQESFYLIIIFCCIHPLFSSASNTGQFLKDTGLYNQTVAIYLTSKNLFGDFLQWSSDNMPDFIVKLRDSLSPVTDRVAAVVSDCFVFIKSSVAAIAGKVSFWKVLIRVTGLQWGSISLKLAAVVLGSSCCIFIEEKTFSTGKNNLAYIWDKCFSLTMC